MPENGTTIGILGQKFKPGAPWWSLSGVVSCDEIVEMETEEKERT